MPIQIDAASMEARYGNKVGGAAQPTPMQDLYAPDVRAEHKTVPTKQAQIPLGTPVPEGTIVQQVVGRGQSMAIVPPRQHEVKAPAIAVVPPSGSNRTSVGTYVEQTRSNPLTDARPVINSGTIEPPIVQELVGPRKKLDLTQSILDHIYQLGGEKSETCQLFYERSQQTLMNWCRNPAIIPLGAVVKFLERAPDVRDDLIEILEPHFAYDNEGGTWSYPNRGKTNAMICSPILGKPTLPYQISYGYLLKKYEMGWNTQADTMITRSRNVLAKRFLESGCLWSLWLDADIAAPIKDPDWLRKMGATTIPNESCDFDVWERISSHRKAVVGGVYAGRWFHGQLIIQPEVKPRSHEDKLLANQIRNGHARGLAEVEWIGFGCALVHRDVFLEVQRRFPQLAPKSEFSPWGYFDTEGDIGEDEAFCQRVRACGIPIYLDTQLICGHVGRMSYFPEHTQSQMAM
jgi:hypothetical protein